MKNLIPFELTLNETKFIKEVPIISNTSNQRLETHEKLRYEFADYDPGSAKHHPQFLGNGYNNYRINFSLRYLSPDEYRQNTFKKVV